MPRSLSIIGFGAFGRFAAGHLRAHFDVRICDRRDVRLDAAEMGLKSVPLSEAGAAEIIVLAVPVQHLKGLLAELAPMLSSRRGAIVVDVCSVKMRPIEMMKRALSGAPGVQIVGTHPLFGPQSGKDGIAGLPIALCRAGADDATVSCVREFLSRTLQLNVIDVQPEEHDRRMAHVQALTHLITRAVSAMDLPDGSDGLATAAYRRLLAMRSNLRDDSDDLFLTIERENPFAADVRRAFRGRLDEIEATIRKSETEIARA